MRIWVRIIPALLILLVNVSWASGDVHVKKGETWRIGLDQSHLALNTLTLEDGARIEFAPGIHLWQLTAETVRIGEGVVIDGGGANGSRGSNGQTAAPANACENGQAGGNGSTGGQGEAGVTLALTLGVQKWGSLSIITRGGDGGGGGQGAHGQNAGVLDGCEQTQGGNGGDGGRGGDGGNGGQVQLSLAMRSPDLTLDRLRQHLHIESGGGKGGAPGKGAAGGEGSPGRWVSMKTLTGSRKFVVGGSAGKDGQDGRAGQPGSPGVITITEDARLRVNAIIDAGSRQGSLTDTEKTAQNNTDKRVQQLQEQVMALQQQVKALQAQSQAQQAAQDAARKDIAALKKQLTQPQ